MKQIAWKNFKPSAISLIAINPDTSQLRIPFYLKHPASHRASRESLPHRKTDAGKSLMICLLASVCRTTASR